MGNNRTTIISRSPESMKVGCIHMRRLQAISKQTPPVKIIGYENG